MGRTSRTQISETATWLHINMSAYVYHLCIYYHMYACISVVPKLVLVSHYEAKLLLKKYIFFIIMKLFINSQYLTSDNPLKSSALPSHYNRISVSNSSIRFVREL